MSSYPIITKKIIDYDSPSGKVIIGKYIPPFEKVDKGFGFKGVILEDNKTGQLQCHICGLWIEQMGSHLSRRHGILGNEYRRMFGLLQSTALKCMRLRLLQSKIMQELRRTNPQNRLSFDKNNKYASNRKGKPKALESKNKYGVCDLQISERIISMSKELQKTPALTDLAKRYGMGFMTLLHSRYGSYVALCKKLGLEPNTSNFNPKYSKEYFINKVSDKEPSRRIFTTNESRALYRYFKGGIKELNEVLN